MQTEVDVADRRGWEIVRLRSPELLVEVVPGKGGDIISARVQPDDVELLWQSPWGLRARGAAGTAGTSQAALMESYPGGWQTVFPNGGDAVHEHGVEWGMHGEAWLAPWDWEPVTDGLTMSTRLVRSPFVLTKQVHLQGSRLTVTETVHNVGGESVEVMWSHHPAFGGALIAQGCRIEAPPCLFVADDLRDMPHGDLLPGATGDWPLVPGRDGVDVDVAQVPSVHEQRDRFGYLTALQEGPMSIVNESLGLAVDLDWDHEVFPCAWMWLEAHASPGFPWFQGVHVLAIEPATSWPGQGLAAVRAKTGTQITVAPDERRTASVSLAVRRS